MSDVARIISTGWFVCTVGNRVKRAFVECGIAVRTPDRWVSVFRNASEDEGCFAIEFIVNIGGASLPVTLDVDEAWFREPHDNYDTEAYINGTVARLLAEMVLRLAVRP